MAITYVKSEWVAAESKYVSETITDAFKGAVIKAYSDYVQVMSDIWENMEHVVVWDEAQGKAVTFMNPAAYEVDATFEVITKYLTWLGKVKFDAEYEFQVAAKTREALKPVKGDKVKVVRGRTAAPSVTEYYPIVVSIERPYKFGWKSVMKRKFALALSDKKGPVIGSNGKTYDSYLDLLWVWEHNVELQPEVIAERTAAAEESAKERARVVMLAAVESEIKSIEKSKGRFQKLKEAA